MTGFSYSDRGPKTAYARHEAMHTVLEVVITGEKEEAARKLSEDIFSLVDRLEFHLSRFFTGGELYELNARTTDGGEFRVGDILEEALRRCADYRERTDGYFDVCAASGGEYVLEKGVIRAKPGTVTVIDLGGFAKGLALDRAGDILRKKGVDRALLNFGSSSVLAIGAHPHGDHWPVGVEDPARAGAELAVFELRDSALSVSGPSRDGRPHIVDPASGGYVMKRCLAAVAGPDAAGAEALSTALYAAPDRIREKIMSGFPDYRYRVIPL